MSEIKTIKYLCEYNTPLSAENRISYPAGCAKIEYLSKALVKSGFKVEIISISMSLDRTYKGKVFNLEDNIKVFLPHSFGRSRIVFFSKLSTLCFYINLIFNLLNSIKNDDVVLVYHSGLMMQIVKILKKFLNFKLILQVEEIYGVALEDEKIVRKEMSFFPLADGYIFPSILLNERINFNKKPFILNHGTYSSEYKRKNKISGFSENKIHCVYAGTFNAIKGGAYIAIRAANYLPDNYHMHIIGFGTNNEVNEIKKLIYQNSYQSQCKITYDGCLSGEEYHNFLQNCDIGLSTQNPEGKFNVTSFPSKILSYMSNGLRVVSIKIQAVELSSVGKYIYYYNKQTPQKLAEAIQSVDFTKQYDGRKIIDSLDRKCVQELSLLISEVKCNAND